MLSIGLHAVALAVHLTGGPGAPVPAAPVAMPEEQVVYISIVTEPPREEAAPNTQIDARIDTQIDAGEFADIKIDNPAPPDEEQPAVADALPLEPEAPAEPESVPETPAPQLSALKLPKKPAPPKPRPQTAVDARPAPAAPVVASPVTAQPAPRPVTPAAQVGKVAQSANAPPSRTQATFPRYLRNPPPAYPQAELRRRREGLVVLHVDVGANGRATTVSVLRSSGIAAFDRAARNAVIGWRFVPATVDGKPVDGTARVPVRFALTQ